MFDDGSAPYESEEDHNLLADIANHITEPVGRVKALIWAMEVLPPPLRETWMDQRLTPEEAAQFKVICRIGNYSYYAYPE